MNKDAKALLEARRWALLNCDKSVLEARGIHPGYAAQEMIAHALAIYYVIPVEASRHMASDLMKFLISTQSAAAVFFSEPLQAAISKANEVLDHPQGGSS